MAGDESSGFARWQKATGEQLGSLINTVLGLAAGLLAFESTLLLERKFTTPFAFSLGLLAVALLGLSIGFALWRGVNRLLDCRLTTQIVRAREEVAVGLAEKRQKSKLLGQTTWRLLTAQLWLFGLGATAGAIAVLLQVLR